MCDCSGNIISINDEICLYELTAGQEETCCSIKNSLDVYGRQILCWGGLFFNSITILLFFNKGLSGVFFNRLLLCLAIFDNMYLIISIMDAWISSQENPNFYHDYAYFFIIYPAKNITMCCTIYMTLLLAFERYNSTTNPHVKKEVSWIGVLKFVLPVVVFSILFKMPTFFDFDVASIKVGGDNNKQSFPNTGYVIAEHISIEKTYNITTRITVSNMRSDELYVLLYMTIANIIFTGVLPVALLAFLNFHIYKGVTKFHQRRGTILSTGLGVQPANDKTSDEITQAKILFAIVLVFVLCHTLRILLNLEDWIGHKTRFDEYENKGCKYGTPYWALVAIPISEILLRVNASINFFIYCAFNKSFRSVIFTHTLKTLTDCGISNLVSTGLSSNIDERQTLLQ